MSGIIRAQNRTQKYIFKFLFSLFIIKIIDSLFCLSGNFITCKNKNYLFFILQMAKKYKVSGRPFN